MTESAKGSMLQNSAKPLIIYSSSAGLMAALPVFILPWIANILGPESFGLFSTARFTVQLLTLFVGSFLGFGLARVFYDDDNPSYYAKLNGANLTALIFTAVLFVIITFGLMATGSALAKLTDDIYQPQTAMLVFVVLAGSLFFVWRQNYHRIIVMTPRPELAALSELSYNVILFGLFWLAVFLGRNWFDLLVVQSVVFALTALTTLLLVIRLRGAKGLMGMDRIWSTDNLTRSAPFLVVGLVTPLLLTVDKYIIGGILGLDKMGQYAATSIYLSGVFLLSGVFQKVYVPETYRLLSQYQKERSEAIWYQLMERLRKVLLMIIPIIASIALGAQIHASLFFDEKYQAAIDITWIVTLAGTSSFVQIALIPFFDSFNKSHRMSVLAFIGLTASFVFLGAGAENFGLRGAAVGLVLGQLAYILFVLVSFFRLKAAVSKKTP